jgi:Fe-S-cluster containining protein
MIEGMEDTNFDKLFSEVFRMNILDVFKKILSFYNCPESCNRVCCRELDIPIDSYSRDRIAKINKRCRKIMEMLVVSDEKGIEFNGNYLETDKMLPLKPCPFLEIKSKKCSIYQQRPDSCKIYPFVVGQTLDKNSPDYPFTYELANCELGFNINVDYAIWGANVALHNNLNAEEFIDTEEEFLLHEIDRDRNKKENLQMITFPNSNAIKGFLTFLLSVPEHSRLAKRLELLNSLVMLKTKDAVEEVLKEELYDIR